MLPKAVRMLRRAEFVQASRSARAIATPFFIVQGVPNAAPDLSRRTSKTDLGTTDSITLGITASRKVGKAVVRNRAKRRLRALLYQTFLQSPATRSPSRRIVLVARKGCLDADFSTMRQQLEQALRRSKAKIS